MLMRMINEEGFLGIKRRVLMIDSDTYGKWRNSDGKHIHNLTVFDTITEERVLELNEDRDIVPYYEEVIAKILTDHGYNIHDDLTRKELMNKFCAMPDPVYEKKKEYSNTSCSL